MMGPATGNADKKKSLATHSCRHQKALQNEQKKSFATVFCSQFPVVEKSRGELVCLLLLYKMQLIRSHLS